MLSDTIVLSSIRRLYHIIHHEVLGEHVHGMTRVAEKQDSTEHWGNEDVGEGPKRMNEQR